MSRPTVRKRERFLPGSRRFITWKSRMTNGRRGMDPFREASYEQLERVLTQIDRLQPIGKPGTGIPALGFLERWIEDTLIPDQDGGAEQTTEWTIQMWERAQPREDGVA
jgi:hypothetical protein